jgi:hypothetical protein
MNITLTIYEVAVIMGLIGVGITLFYLYKKGVFK